MKFSSNCNFLMLSRCSCLPASLYTRPAVATQLTASERPIVACSLDRQNITERLQWTQRNFSSTSCSHTRSADASLQPYDILDPTVLANHQSQLATRVGINALSENGRVKLVCRVICTCQYAFAHGYFCIAYNR